MSAEDQGPRHTNALIGHDGAERAFLDAWNSGRLAHAWLICGPRGIGKATLAYRIARFALANGGGEAGGGGLFGAPAPPASLDLSPNHPVFRRVAAGGHADLRVVERSVDEKSKTQRLRTEIVVDDVRGVGSFLSLTPAEGGWRVVLIDSACEMNSNSANAVLKVLEEPPKQALMLLVCHSPGRLLPTIRSRCRRLTMQPLADSVVLDLLRRQRPDLAEADALAVARLAEGSIGRALNLAAEGGLELYREVIGLLATLPRLDVPALHAFGDRVAKADESWRTVSQLLTWWLARMVRLGGRQESGVAEVVPGEAAVMARLLSAAALDRWVEVWEKITHLFGRADAVHLDRKQVILSAFLTVERLSRP